MKPVIKLGISIGLFIALIVFVQLSYGWRALLTPWQQLPIVPLVSAVLLVFGSYVLRTLRLFDYFLAEMRGGFWVSVRLMLLHNLFNNFLPMRTGELSFPVLMARYFALPPQRSLPALLWFRVLDLHTLLLLALLALALPELGVFATSVMALLWLSLPWWLWHFSQRLKTWLQPRPDRWSQTLLLVIQGLPRNRAEFWRSGLWTLVNWLVKLGVFAWVMLQFLPMALQAALMGAIAGDLTSVLPVHGLAGAGTYEAGVVAVLLPYGIAASQALMVAVNLHLFILGATLLGGAMSLLLPNKHSRSNTVAAQPYQD